MTPEPTNPLAGLGTLGQKQHFEHVIEGIYGTFETPAGKVAYLQTKAKVGGDGSTHGKLIKALLPAREALNIQEMDFNQLLQRDLDDHRIATKLIEYVLNPPANSLPGFYPPILALLLPFDQTQQPVDHFPAPTESFEVDAEFANLRFRCITHSNAYRAQFAVNTEDDDPLQIPLAVLRWNPDLSKMVIMDGQHRAMSLLAIQRTVTNSWNSVAKGARYQPFYEHHVRTWMDKAKAEGKTIELSKIELPVTICWFPETPGATVRPKPHLAARKLFVDVNNNAKPPSEARLVLLSDTQLDNIFARELLNRLRRDERWRDTFPLFGVEYDNPDKSSTSPRRWSVITSLDIIKDAVVRTVFGPPKIINDPAASLQGKPALRDMDIRMRAQLDVGSLFPKEFHDGERLIVCENLGNLVFPLNDSDKTEKLLNKFYDTWGQGILTLLSGVEPYKAHLKALQERYTYWNPADNNATLAKDALFEGVGMLWTIEEGHKLWQLECKNARDAKEAAPGQPDISRAWEILEKDQKPTFQKRRAKLYLESDDDADVTDCDRLFKGLITYAAQVGLMLSWASLHAKAAPTVEPNKLANALVKAINATLCTGPTNSRTRRRILLKKSELDSFYPLNSLPKLEPAYASQYRYFWLELALAKEGRIHLEEAGVDLPKADQLLNDSCRVYLRLLVEDRMRLRLRDPEIRKLSQAEQKEKAGALAREAIVEEQAQARKFWFGNPIEQAREKIDLLLKNGSFPVQNGTDAVDLEETADEDQSDETDDEDEYGI
jgi:hypothetical protein